MEQGARPEAPPRRTRIGLYIIRWLAIVGVLIISQLRFTTEVVHSHQILLTVMAMALLTLVLSLISGGRIDSPVRAVNAIVDILFVSVIVYYSGGLSSPFYPLYYIALISTAVIYGTKGAVFGALAIGSISLVVQASLKRWALSDTLLVDDVVQTFPYLFLIALIAGALRDRLQALDEAASILRAERAATDREMEVARRVQQAQLPQEIPKIEGVEIAILYNPAQEVGGDLYDFYPVNEDRIGIAVADVAGKGVPAALLVSSAKYGLYEHFSENLAKMATDINHHLISVTTSESFVTLAYGILTIKTGEFRYINAGHMPPIVLKADGRTLCHSRSDIPLGIMESADYSEQTIHLEPGDVLILYSDGITDALESSGGLESLEAFLREVHGSDISTWGLRLTQRIGEPRHIDDMTMVALYMKSS
ncbi:MAG: PP2C family protein-serine/threonine phosphatase [Armatimonadota bacterium]|nr:SpoIIE family protein phosphatase [bacterium]